MGSCTTFCFPMFDIMGFKKEWSLIVSEEQKDFNGVFTFNERFTIHLVVKARENSSHKIEIYFIRKLLLLSLVLLLWTCYSKNLPSSIQTSLLLRYSVHILWLWAQGQRASLSDLKNDRSNFREISGKILSGSPKPLFKSVFEKDIETRFNNYVRSVLDQEEIVCLIQTAKK